ncbi:hypothetical protein CXU15_11150 [Akkermansia muciniphila]|uniref:Uncharacterized protein n=1 Tax=Akkermansia massiliensis TaxID=2927224 RepID=A0AAE6TBR6_9BACT|nr:hypothetical protein CXU15_11150 [Akkermansia muciniphila]PNC49348.1 hypothetical protein CXU11_06440 [Akkermansia muciniphila]QHV62406.1 hypothetical protein DMI76_03030 [Akkermansia massiliensis]QHV74771.1 hypothetical protein DMI75_03015 [Akkermansia massiliensis]
MKMVPVNRGTVSPGECLPANKTVLHSGGFYQGSERRRKGQAAFFSVFPPQAKEKERDTVSPG